MLQNWKKNFFGWNAANFGWGGDTTNNILWRLENGELDGLRPKAIVILAGTNNFGDAHEDTSARDVADGIKAIVRTCKRKAPNAKIILTAIFPRNDKPQTLSLIRETNRIIAEYAKREQICLININGKLADSNGNLYPGMMMDGLHPTAKGYDVWACALKPILTNCLGRPAKVDEAPPPTGDPSINVSIGRGPLTTPNDKKRPIVGDR